MKEYVVWAILATLFYLMISQQVFANDVGYSACKMEIRLELVSIPRDQILVYNSSVEAIKKKGSMLYAGIPTSQHRACYLIARHIEQLVLQIKPEDINPERRD